MNACAMPHLVSFSAFCTSKRPPGSGIEAYLRQGARAPGSRARAARFKLGPADAPQAAEPKEAQRLANDNPDNFVNALQIRCPKPSKP